MCVCLCLWFAFFNSIVSGIFVWKLRIVSQIDIDRHKWKCDLSGKHQKQRIQLILSLETVVFTLAFTLPSGKKRKPAWTDRILWRTKPKTPPSEDDDDEKASTSTDDGLDEYPLLVTQDKYASDMRYGVSDHKPVIATFSLEVRADSLSDTRSLFCAAQFCWSAHISLLFSFCH